MSALGLYRLLTPYFLAGVTFPEEADSYLSAVSVTDVTGAYDGSASVVTGTVQFGNVPRVHKNAAGGGFRWEDAEVRFRLTVPRDGAGFVDTAAHALPSQFAPLTAVLDRFRPVDQTATAPTEYPGVRFRLELLFDELHFELSDDWRPGLIDADHRIARDAAKTDPVRIVLPRVAFAYEQTDDFQTPPAISLVSWGGGGFDAPSELRAGELVRMEPPIAAHRSGRVGFGLGAVIVDLDPDNTPPEILQFFGADESFEGIYVQSARFYYADQGKDLAVNAAVKDLLISFAGAVSFDASVDLIGPQSTLAAELTVIDGGKDVPVSPGRLNPPDKVFKGGKVRMSSAATVRVQVTGGVPPVTVSVHDENGTERSDAAAKAVNIVSLSPGEHTLSLSVRDSAPGTDQQSYDEDVEVTLVPAPAATATKPGAPADRPAQPGDIPAITTSGGVSGAFAIRAGGNAGGTHERFPLDGPGTPTVTANGQPVPASSGMVVVDVPENTTNLQIVADWPIQAGEPETFTLYFTKSWPADAGFSIALGKYLDDSIGDMMYESSARGGQPVTGTKAVHAWLDQLGQLSATLPTVTVDTYASYEPTTSAEYDQALTERRRTVAIGAIGALAQVTGGSPHGHQEAEQAGRVDQQSDRKAVISATVTQPGTTVTLLVSRGARTPPAQDVVPQPVPPPSRAADRACYPGLRVPG